MIFSDEQYAVVAAKDAEIAALGRVLAHTVLGRDRAMARVAVLEGALVLALSRVGVLSEAARLVIREDNCGDIEACAVCGPLDAALSAQPAATGEGT